jgi:hypothetical protein
LGLLEGEVMITVNIGVPVTGLSAERLDERFDAVAGQPTLGFPPEGWSLADRLAGRLILDG